MRTKFLLTSLCIALAGLAASAASGAAGPEDPPSLETGLTVNGRQLDPVGEMAQLGAFPTGGALTPDDKYYWAVDAGRGENFVHIIDVATAEVVQSHQIPGGFFGVAFGPSGRRAYVSGQRAEGEQPEDAKGTKGDVIHVYKVDKTGGKATELEPIKLPGGHRDGAAADDTLPPSSGVKAWPAGLEVTPDGSHLVVALGQADQAAIIKIANGKGKLVDIGRYPYGVAIAPDGERAYISNERDGTVSVIGVPGGEQIATIPLGGEARAGYPHPEGLVVDPTRDRLYVAVTDRDFVAVIDTKTNEVERRIEVGRPEAAIGSAPVNIGVAPGGETLYVANAGEDAILAIALERRPRLDELDRGSYRKSRSLKSIGRYRKGLIRARRARDRALAGGSAAEQRAARKEFKQKRKRLQKKRLYGKRRKACGGPNTRQDRRYAKRVFRAHKARARARAKARRLRNPKRRKAALQRANSRYRKTTFGLRKRLPKFVRCLPPGAIPGTAAFSKIGRFPTAAYPVDVELTDDGERLVWLAAKGFGTGPRTLESEIGIKKLLRGRAGVMERPTDREMAEFTPRADAAVLPANLRSAPPNTPIVGPGGGPSEKIKYVFYVVKENRTYDQIFGSDPRGQGDPAIQLFDDNGVPGPTGGITPNAHELSRQFALYDNVYANTEESTAGHKITAGAYANDYLLRKEGTSRGKAGDPDIFPIGTPPGAFIFDQAVRDGVGFHVYGELGAGNQPFADEGRPTYEEVQANTDPDYPSQVQGTCRSPIPYPPGTPLSVRCTADAGTLGATAGPPNAQSRINTFKNKFAQQLATNTVPAFNYLILFNNHTDGSTPGVYTPRANVADNDLGLGQLVELVSQSDIWEESAIFVIEDDSQDGPDSVDAHRIPALVISPWAKRGGQVISTRFDQYGFLRTVEMILGMSPLSINDALALPLYDAFISGDETPDVEGTRYTAIQPEVSMTETNPANAPNAALSEQLPYDQVDRVPQRISDRILWQSIFGRSATPPPPGPNASPTERARAIGAIRRFRSNRNIRRFLMNGEESENESKLAVTARILSLTLGLSAEDALEAAEGELEAEE